MEWELTRHTPTALFLYIDLKKAVHLNALLSILGEKFQNRGFSNLFGWDGRGELALPKDESKFREVR
jgi:hypothetical protein